MQVSIVAKFKINLKEGTLKKTKQVIGIDLGTTNSLVAIVNQTNQKAYCLEDTEGKITASVIHISNSKETIVGTKAMPFLTSDSKNTVNSIKRLMGKSYTDVLKHNNKGYELVADETNALVNIKIQGKKYNPIQLSSFILKSLKAKAENILNDTVSSAVITVPAYFNDAQRQATRDAGKLAGLDVLRIINEPTAASLAYGIGLEKSDERTIAVYDLGGGTFDVTILTIQNGVFEVLSTNGNTETGGDDFDALIIKHWMEAYVIDINQNTENYQLLRTKAEKAKIYLSNHTLFQETITINAQDIKLSLSKEIFEALIHSIVDKTIKSCKTAMQDAELNLKEINEVVMVGGSTRVPLVLQKVSEFFKYSEINNTINPDEVVALGAAIEADILAGNRKDIFLLDVTPLSLGIETAGGLMDTIIPRNNKVPTRAGRQYTTSIDGQTSLKISIYQGERELVADNRKLGEFILKNIPAMPAGLPKIDIQFFIDADGILKVEAKELRSETSQTIEIKPQYGLTDQQVEYMLLDALKNAEQDVKNRLLAETTSEAEQLIYQTNKLFKNNTELLSVIERDTTLEILKNLQEAINKKEEDAIKTQIERLNTYTRPFAEKIMDIAIGNALKGKKV